MQQVPEHTDYAMILSGVHWRLKTCLAFLEPILHRCRCQVVGDQTASLEQFARVCRLTKHYACSTRCNFISKIVGDKSEITHLEFLLYLLLELLNCSSVTPSFKGKTECINFMCVRIKFHT
jgi:hypothetical protein